MKFKKMSYYSFGCENFPGVMKKINNTVKAATKIGIDAEHKLYTNKNKFISIKDLFFDNSDLIFIRFSYFIHTFLFIVILYKRFMGVKIVIDVATPRTIALREMRNSQTNHLKIKILWNFIFSSWILFPANKIIQYADESFFFSLGISHKTLKMGNGIFIDDSIALIKQEEKVKTLFMIGVASVAFWHGYDRLIKAIALFHIRYPDFTIRFKVVGDGEVLPELKALVNKLELNELITFTGALYDADLEQSYIGMNIGVSSLGLFRKGLNEASDLKTREYLAKGLCVLGSGKDPDFATDSQYRYIVPNDDSVEPIVEKLWDLINMKRPDAESVRGYAEKNLAYEGKLKTILMLV